MNYSFLLEEKNLTMYECSKRSGIPYSTLADIINGKTAVEKASFETAHKLASVLNISMDELFSKMHIPDRPSFENFKSQIQHDLRREGSYEFILNTIQNETIRTMWQWQWYLEALYLLALIDYLSRQNRIPLCNDYDAMRKSKIERMVFPAGVIALGTEKAKQEAIKKAIPEFLRFNIVETEIGNVI